MPSKQSEAVRRRWEASRLAMVQPGFEAPDDESWGDLTAEPRGVDYLETEAGGLPAMWAVPKRASTDRVLMCIHGGGFVSGSIYTHRKMFGHLAKAAGARALLVSYHLLPEGVFPVPADDVTNAYRWLLDQGISAGRIAASPPRSPATATALTGWASSPSRRQASPASPCSAVAPTWRPSSASRWSAREPRDKHPAGDLTSMSRLIWPERPRRRQARVVIVTFLREATVVAMLAGSVLAVCRAWVNRQRVSTFGPGMAVAASRAWVAAEAAVLAQREDAADGDSR